MSASRDRDLERGQSLMETALVVPFLGMILLGLVEVGRYAHYSIAVANSARAGAEYGSLSAANAANSAGMVSAATNDANVSPVPTATATTFCQCFNGGASTCATTDCSGTGDHINYYVQVTVTGTYTGLFNYPGLPHTITISKTAQMQHP